MSLLDKVKEKMTGDEETLSQDMCTMISMLDGEKGENIYLLILDYYSRKAKGDIEDLKNGKEIPFSGKPLTKTGKGLSFKVSHIPEDLQKILFRYMKLISI